MSLLTALHMSYTTMQGLTLVHFSAQLETRLVTEPLKPPSVSLKRYLR
jgi:hypothetical protein